MAARKESSSNSELGEPLSSSVPIVALINLRSGGGKGKIAAENLKKIDNVHVVDIMDFAKKDTTEPDGQLRELLERLNGQNVRMIVGGGDGTVTWAFEILDRVGIHPPIAVLPLGTANEVSGCVGWKNSNSGRHMERFVTNLRKGQEFVIDFWHMKYEDDPSVCEEKTEEPFQLDESVRRPATMVAFFSIGFDADIAHKFHEHREAKETPSTSTFANKFEYFKIGWGEVFKPGEKLRTWVGLRVDDQEVQIPGKDADGTRHGSSIRCLQVLNINSMAGGVDFWGTAASHKEELQEFSKPHLDDGKMEVTGTKTVHHMNNVRMGVGHAIRLAQGTKMVFTLKKPLPIEVDGEAWVNPPGRVIIEHAGQHPMVLGPKISKSVSRGVGSLFS